MVEEIRKLLDSSIHICLVSREVAANLLPLTDEEMNLKKVVLVTTSEMEETAKNLIESLKLVGISDVSQERLTDAYDLIKLTDEFNEIAKKYGSDSVALNLTGGTKLMAIAAYQGFYGGCPIYYYNNNLKEIQLLVTENQKPIRYAIKSQLKIKPYLRAYGYEVIESTKNSISKAKNNLTGYLVKNAKRYSRTLGMLNGLAQEAKNRPNLSVPLVDWQMSNNNLKELLEKLQSVGVLKYDGRKVQFVDESNRFYANGGWLEDYIFELLNQLKNEKNSEEPGAFSEVLKSVKIRTVRNKTKNEIDVMFLANNKLYLIECKTANLSDNDKANNVLYKLDSQSSIGGIETQKILVSYRSINDAQKDRANDQNMHVLDISFEKDIKKFFNSIIN